jgi:multicomponent Na+:H+ antiporter subunit A
MLLAVLSGFITALLLVGLGRHLKGKLSVAISLLPVSLFVYFLQYLPSLGKGDRLYFSYNWIPSLGVNFDFFLDGLSMIFCLLITGIGSLIFLYASSYLKGHIYLDRFFGYLSLFMGSMLGLVLSDNIFTLFVFWELTSISSFFLIGFNNENASSRKSSLMALAITGGGGFLLLTGMVLIGSIGGSYSIQELINSSAVLKEHGLYIVMIVLLFGGAFTKSAQFPFHFWLPGAMKAPTPVSAYLHSATMVKAGIYLLARFTPVLGDHPYWNNTLMVVGGFTMLYTAIHALFRTDLKSILAYSTIAALGILVFLIGIGTQQALIAAAVFILVHAFYKAGLFLITGVIDHETGTRDITRLSGLRLVMMPLALAGLMAALSNAGIPFTFGFLGKDLVYEATLDSERYSYLLTGAAVLTNILLLYAGFVAGIKPFAGKVKAEFAKVHLPGPLLWVPPLLLGLGGLLFGIFPGLIDKALIQPAVLAMFGGPVDISLKIWHGFNLVLLLSVITVTLGILLYIFSKPSKEKEKATERFDVVSPLHLTVQGGKHLRSFSAWYTVTLQNGHLRFYIFVIVSFLMGLLAYKLFTGVNIYLDRTQLSELTSYEVVVSLIMLTSIGITVSTESRLTAVAAMGVIGYCICLLFVFYSAPDLAMTQFTIDTLTVVLFVLVLFRLPPFLNFTNTKAKIRDAILSISFGGLIATIALEVLNESVNKDVSKFYGDNAYTLAKGKNVVNVILVDFRGIDTVVEITVLTIAAIGVYSLLKLKINSKGENQL